MNKTVYSKYVYLFELDSVRTSPAEIKQAIKALYTETVYNRNIVVLSFNQVVDSLPFISMMTNEKSYEDLFRLFENGYIKISQYKSTRTIIQYLLQKITPLLDSVRRSEKPFVFSALPINSSQRRLLSLMRRCLINSDLTELNEYVEGKRSETELRDLFVEVYPVRNEKADETVSFERIGDCYIIPVSSDVTVKELKNNLSALGIILSHLLRLSTVDDIYLSPRDEKEYKEYTLSTFLDLAHSSLLMSDENYAKAIQFIDENIESKRYEQKPRSFYYEQFQRLETDEKDKTVYRYAEAIINNCYNYACEFSMQNISKHYNVNEDGSIDLQSFCCDFQKRLEEQVKNMQCCMEKAKTASDTFEFCDIYQNSPESIIY